MVPPGLKSFDSVRVQVPSGILLNGRSDLRLSIRLTAIHFFPLCRKVFTTVGGRAGCDNVLKIMTTIKLRLLPVLCLISAGLFVVPAVEASPELFVQAASVVSKDEAAALARQATGGRVLDIQAEDRNGRTVYRVKVLLDGRVRFVQVDAQSGNVSD